MSGSTGNSGSGGGDSYCGACRYLKRKCITGCIFAPYFDSEQGVNDFAIVEKVFDPNNVSKLLHQIPDHHNRLKAVKAIIYEAQVRVDDPIHGCCGRILKLERQLQNLQEKFQNLKEHARDLEERIQNRSTTPVYYNFI